MPKKEYDLEKDMLRMQEIKELIQSGNVKVNDIIPLTEESMAISKRVSSELSKIKELLSQKKQESV